MAPAGIEPATLALEVPCSDPTELRSLVHAVRETISIITKNALRRFFFSGAPDRIRTYDLSLRKRTLYPAELRVHET